MPMFHSLYFSMAYQWHSLDYIWSMQRLHHGQAEPLFTSHTIKSDVAGDVQPMSSKASKESVDVIDPRMHVGWYNPQKTPFEQIIHLKTHVPTGGNVIRALFDCLFAARASCRLIYRERCASHCECWYLMAMWLGRWVSAPSPESTCFGTF